jgi:hypothetical protein
MDTQENVENSGSDFVGAQLDIAVAGERQEHR